MGAATCLLDDGADINAKDNQGFSPLIYAAQQGHLPLVDLLVLRGADLNLANNYGATSLSMAAQDGLLEVVKLLVKKGSNIDQSADLGVTPLHKAALYGHQEIVDYLMSKGATFEATGTLAKVCKCCGAADADLKCALCLTVYYCCKACQVRDWKEGGKNSHKVQCKSLIQIRESYVEKCQREIEEKMAEF